MGRLLASALVLWLAAAAPATAEVIRRDLKPQPQIRGDGQRGESPNFRAKVRVATGRRGYVAVTATRMPPGRFAFDLRRARDRREPCSPDDTRNPGPGAERRPGRPNGVIEVGENLGGRAVARGRIDLGRGVWYVAIRRGRSARDTLLCRVIAGRPSRGRPRPPDPTRRCLRGPNDSVTRLFGTTQIVVRGRGSEPARTYLLCRAPYTGSRPVLARFSSGYAERFVTAGRFLAFLTVVQLPGSGTTLGVRTYDLTRRRTVVRIPVLEAGPGWTAARVEDVTVDARGVTAWAASWPVPRHVGAVAPGRTPKILSTDGYDAASLAVRDGRVTWRAGGQIRTARPFG